ncbi:MAG TPA: mechanosensitive ion channel domain-containing protein [Oxalicibacterium sp.]
MNPNLLSTFWTDLSTDLGNSGLRWQVAALLSCIAVGWLLARLIRGMFTADGEKQGVRRFGVASFSRVLWPLLTLVLIVIARLILEPLITNVDLLRIAIPLIGSFALIRLSFYVMRRIFAKGGRVGNFVLLFEKSFALLVWIVVALHITGLLPDLEAFLEQTTIPLGTNRVSIMTALQAALSVCVTMIVALWASALLEERLMRLDSVHSSMRAVLSRMARAVLVLLALLISLSMVGIDLTVLSVFGGALGVGLGLGLQKIASSYVSGFIILLERSLSIGDMVSVDRFSGRVAQINTRYTVLRTGDGSSAVVPNDLFVSGSVQNFSLMDSVVLMSTTVSVDYRTDIDLALQLLEEATQSQPRIRRDGDRAPKALMMAFGADGINLQLNFWVNESERGGVLSDVNRAIWKLFQMHQINVPFPQREIRLADEQYTAVKERLNVQQVVAKPDLPS